MKLYLCLAWLLLMTNTRYSQSSSQQIVPLGQKRSVQHTSGISLYLNAAKWNELFPNRFGFVAKKRKNNSADFYSYKAFVTAAHVYPEFLSGNTLTQKRELAAFLANIAQETSGGWAEAPGGYFKWGLCFIEEKQELGMNIYADTTKKNYLPIAGKTYYGRGPKQLSWNYNYGQFSEAWFGCKDTLLQHPEMLSKDPVLSFASAIWFWMTPQIPKPSCHDIMTGHWKPTEADLQNGRTSGFGATVNVINGGVECGTGKDLEKTSYRYQYYQYFCNFFGVSPGENISCSNQKPFGQ